METLRDVLGDCGVEEVGVLADNGDVFSKVISSHVLVVMMPNTCFP